MPRRSSSSYSANYSALDRRNTARRMPSPLPYLVLALLASAGLAYFHYFAYKSISGTVTNAFTAAPLPNVPVRLIARPGTEGTSPLVTSDVLTTTTSADGTFGFEKIPADPIVSVQAEGFGEQTVEAAGKGSIAFSLLPSTLSGQIIGVDGKPLPGAAIVAGAARTASGADGSYLITDVPADRKLVVKAPGYLASTVQVGQVMTHNVSLQPFIAKAIYLNADTIATPGRLTPLIELIERTELNAVVIDVKADNSGSVLYNSELPLVRELGTANPVIPNLEGLVTTFKEKNIYTIARISVFWDEAVTGAKPDWALQSKKAPGQVWLDGSGKRWSNPYNPQVRDYNIAVAREVAAAGFNEVQFDNLHFPSDGELEDIEFGPDAVGKKRTDAIAEFLQKAYAELSPLGVYVAVDTFGLTAYVQDDMGVGHNFELLAAYVDYVCPSIYPALFGDGFMNFPKPAEQPFEIVAETLRTSTLRLGTAPARIRPWLQDFSGKVVYDAAKVRLEIDAAEQNGAVGWMLWNFGNTYTEPALKAP